MDKPVSGFLTNVEFEATISKTGPKENPRYIINVPKALGRMVVPLLGKTVLVVVSDEYEKGKAKP